MHAGILLHCVDQHIFCTSLSKDLPRGRFAHLVTVSVPT